MNKIFIFFISTLFIFFTIIFLNLGLKNYYSNIIINIPKGSSINKVVEVILKDNNFYKKKIFFYYLVFYDSFIDKIKYGEFKFKKSSNLIEVTNIISKKSNVFREFKVIGGWQNYQLEKVLQEKFNETYLVPYDSIIADTYNYQFNNNFEDIYKIMINNKNIFFNYHKNNVLLKKLLN